MSDNNHSYRPSLGEVLQVAFSAEQYGFEAQPADDLHGPVKPSKISLYVGKAARAIGLYSVLKEPAQDPIDAALSDPSRPLTFTQAVQLGLRQG